MKKFTAMLLALVLIFSMSITAFAYDPTDNPGKSIGSVFGYVVPLGSGNPKGTTYNYAYAYAEGTTFTVENTNVSAPVFVYLLPFYRTGRGIIYWDTDVSYQYLSDEDRYYLSNIEKGSIAEAGDGLYWQRSISSFNAGTEGVYCLYKQLG